MKAGWTTKRLSELGSAVREAAQVFAEAEYELWSVPSFASDEPEITIGKDIGSAKLRVRPNDILICKINPRINRVWLVRESANGRDQIASTEWLVFRVRHDAGLLPSWLIHFVSAPKFREWIASEVSGATGSHTRAKADGILQQQIPVPPLPEQQRIVGILDEAFEGIATAKANAEKNLQNARALFESHLQSAFTKAWETCELVTLSDVATSITDGDHMPPPKAPTGVPFITIGNIAKDTRKIDFADTFMVPREYFDGLKENKKPRKGDLLYSVTGSFGIPVVVDRDVEFCFQRHIGLIRPKPETNSSWLYYLLLSPQLLKQANEQATGTAQKTVSLTALRGFTVPSVPLAEQRTAVARLDGLAEGSQRLESLYRRKLAALEALKKALLHEAFTGQL